MSTLEVRDVTVRFAETTVLDRASISLAGGEIVALVGPSGSGKSTLLRVIAGILAPDSGSVHIDDMDVTRLPTHRRGVGMVFQDNQLFPHMSTIDNVMFGPKVAGLPRAERAARADRWLRQVGLGGFDERSVTELSGGEAKRVALARTMAAEPTVVLLDEPLTGLDRELHDRLADDLAELLRSAGITTLLVTHDADEAAMIADHTVTLTDLVSGPADAPPTAR
jgi:thiamine transport system ATP-binding protein